MPARPTLIGVPYDASSSFLRGAADGPPIVRHALFSAGGNTWSEALVESIGPDVLHDAGDLVLPTNAEASRGLIEEAIAALASPFIAIGGDHSITYPILRGMARRSQPLTILHIDAHPDLYDEFEGDRFSHACPFARIMEENLATRLVQVGIRAMTAHQRDQAKRFGVEQIDMRAWERGERPSVHGHVYVSLDLDGLDPAFAPGVSHREPGGLSVRDVLTLIDGQSGRFVGADVVEFNPKQDSSGVTAAVAAKFVKELSSRLSRDAAPA